MRYTPESTSKIQAVLACDTIKSGKKADKIVMCPVFINQEEERMFTKRANECMGMRKYLTIRNT